jgi:hypothetical protein
VHTMQLTNWSDLLPNHQIEVSERFSHAEFNEPLRGCGHARLQKVGAAKKGAGSPNCSLDE